MNWTKGRLLLWRIKVSDVAISYTCQVMMSIRLVFIAKQFHLQSRPATWAQMLGCRFYIHIAADTFSPTRPSLPRLMG